ncbi:hypothetical protein PIIN_02077 [Serendipita indica DSM 11827]|uniref:F-box domain-containing protein n=1 Tax=Serendipita indica (strain DSM 11827) TaxID=1109443 RepID=G4TAA3_SERID|nr:hypothetical protein PIIN_02077 [Serendipita indica DSM 11827]
MAASGALSQLQDLPEALIFEICEHLDIFSLVSLSEVDRFFYKLANERPSFWIYTLTHSGLLLPLYSFRSLPSFSARELYIAAHRAVLTERNLSSQNPKLLSYRYIPWPYDPAPGVSLAAGAWEMPEEAVRMHLSHYNGEWMFTVSSNNILRILHLRSGKVGLMYDQDRYEGGMDDVSRVSWAVEFRETDHAYMVMNCYLQGETGPEPSVRLLNVRFFPETALATVETISTYSTPIMTSHLDLAGGYIVATIPRTDNEYLGDVHMIRMRDMKPMVLPPLYPALRIAAFEEYFLSTAISPTNQVYVQVVGYPHYVQGKEESEPLFSLRSYHIPYRGPIFDRGTPFGCQTCHFYTGQQYSPIKFWIRPGRSGSWQVFTLNLDVKGLRSMASRVATGRAGQEETLTKTYWIMQEDSRILEEKGLHHWCIPAMSGRRYLWWRNVLNTLPSSTPSPEVATNGEIEAYGEHEDTPNEETEVEIETFQLFTAVTDHLATPNEVYAQYKSQNYEVDLTTVESGDEDSAGTRQLRSARKLEIPRGLSCRTSSIYMFLMEEWSGTVLVQMYSGDLWVLRYGKR